LSLAAVDPLEVVGAVATVLGLLVAVYFGLRPRRPRPEQTVTSGLRPSPDDDQALELTISWGWPTYDDGSVGEDSFSLTLINRKHHLIRWSSLSIELPDGHHMPVMGNMVPPGMYFPLTIDPQSSGTTLVAVAAIRAAGVPPRTPIRGRATLATGEVVRSQTLES
jgi:hypothetical protein